MDYVFDWARDLYRPSILRRLKSLASGKAYDQVTLTTDSDIPSMKAEKTSISNWIQPPPDIGDGFVAVALNEQTLLPLSIQSRAVATLKLASHVSFRLDALYVTEDNINHLLQATSGIRKDTNGTKSKKTARDILNFFSGWDGILQLSGKDLDLLEEAWTGRARIKAEDETNMSTTAFYVCLEVRSFLDTSWRVAREITYLAISKSAFKMLVSSASWRNSMNNITSIPQTARLCSGRIVLESMDCFLNVSRNQALIAAVSCVRLSAYALPQHGSDCQALGFQANSDPKMSKIVQRFHHFMRKGSRSAVPSNVFSNTSRETRTTTAVVIKNVPPIRKISFIRTSERVRKISKAQDHEKEFCTRCKKAEELKGDCYRFPSSRDLILSPFRTLMVESLINLPGEDRQCICIFATDGNMFENSLDTVPPQVVSNILETGFLYHTIQHPLPACYNETKQDVLWNLPFQYSRRNPNSLSESNVSYAVAWRKEPKDIYHYWTSLQRFLRYLNKGIPWGQANTLVDVGIMEPQHLAIFYDTMAIKKQTGRGMQPARPYRN